MIVQIFWSFPRVYIEDSIFRPRQKSMLNLQEAGSAQKTGIDRDSSRLRTPVTVWCCSCLARAVQGGASSEARLKRAGYPTYHDKGKDDR